MKLPEHIRELSGLLGREVDPDELLSLEATAELQKQSDFLEAFGWLCLVPFETKNTDRFRHLLNDLAARNGSRVYVWTAKALECGAVLADSLKEIDFGFGFEFGAGHFWLITEDLADRVVFDWSLLPSGQKVLEIEVSGKSWSKARFVCGGE